MGVSAVSGGTYSTSDTTRSSTSELGKDQFLNLLITQLRYQDPLSPMDNTEYVSQLAQFSALEQMTSVNNGINSMQALSMTGKMVNATVTDSTTGETSQVEGMVDSVKLKNGNITLMVDGKEVDLANVSAVYDYERADVSNLSAMIGKKCEGYIYDSSTLDVLNVQGTVTGIEKGAYEDYALVDGVEGELKSITSEDYSSKQTQIDYLNEHIGEEISLEITDSDTGKVVPVTATLESATEDDGVITVVLNGVRVPVDSIYNVSQ